jgi:hypothetical protein
LLYGGISCCNNSRSYDFTGGDVWMMKIKSIIKSKRGDGYIDEYTTPKSLRQGINDYIIEYNTERPHQSLAYMYPIQVYKPEKAA